MKGVKRAVCAVLALVIAASAASCVRSTPKKEVEDISETVLTTREYVYKGAAVEDLDEDITESATDKRTEKETQKDKNNPIQNMIDKLPESIRPDKDEETEKNTIKIDIPSGLTMVQIFALVESKGIASFSDLMNAAQNLDFTYYPLIKAQKNTGRAYVLEGYLCSGEYEFYENSKPEDVISAMLRKTESKITTQHRRQIAKQGKTIDDIIIIASIIEKESVRQNEMKKISAVINNRLAEKMKLEMNSCAMYIDSDIKPYVDNVDAQEIKRYEDYYNTLVCPALPAGPICSPSSAAIDAALNPQGDYKYFCVDTDGKYYFSTTEAQYEADLVALGYMEAPETQEYETQTTQETESETHSQN